MFNLGRLVLSQFVRCEHSRWNIRLHSWSSSVRYMSLNKPLWSLSRVHIAATEQNWGGLAA